MKKSITVILVLTTSLLCGNSNSEALNWHQCLGLTLRNHPGLQSAREKIKQSKAGRGIARSLFLPALNGTASLSKTKSDNESYSSYSYGLTVEQLVFDGFNSVNSYLKAGVDIDTALYDYLVVESNTLYTTRIAFINLLKAQKYISTAESILKRRSSNYKLVKMRYRAGREHIGSVLSSEADKENARADFNQAKRNLKLKQKILYASMGLTGKLSVPVVKGLMGISVNTKEKPDCRKLAERNPVLKKMISLRESAAYDKKLSYSGYYPHVYAFLNADASGVNWKESEKKISAGVSMNLSLFEGGKTYYSVKKAKSQYRQALYDEKNTRLDVVMMLEEKWSDLLYKGDRVNVQAKYYKAVRERAKIAESQYSIGLITFDNWTIIEESLVTITQKYLESRIDLLLAEAEWVQAKGEIYVTEK